MNDIKRNMAVVELGTVIIEASREWAKRSALAAGETPETIKDVIVETFHVLLGTATETPARDGSKLQ